MSTFVARVVRSTLTTNGATTGSAPTAARSVLVEPNTTSDPSDESDGDPDVAAPGVPSAVGDISSIVDADAPSGALQT